MLSLGSMNSGKKHIIDLISKCSRGYIGRGYKTSGPSTFLEVLGGGDGSP